jgi:hypothetical protein
MVEDGVYHGHGKLTTSSGTVEGEFRDGKLISTNYRTTKQPLRRLEKERQSGSMMEFEERKYNAKDAFRLSRKGHSHQPAPAPQYY